MKRANSLVATGLCLGLFTGYSGDTTQAGKMEYSSDPTMFTDEQRAVLEQAREAAVAELAGASAVKLVLVEGKEVYSCPNSGEDHSIAAIDDFGPFFCDENNTFYINAGFINESVKEETRADAIATKAYLSFIVGHEVGHAKQREDLGAEEYNKVPKAYRDELAKDRGIEEQADCYGGQVIDGLDSSYAPTLANLYKKEEYQVYTPKYGTDSDRAESLLRGATTGICELNTDFNYYPGLAFYAD